MKCVECGSEELKYDDVSDMYFCDKCNKLFAIDELEPQDTTVSENFEEEDLNGLSLTVLHLIQSIPVIGIIAPLLIANSNVKQEYKKAYAYRFISRLLILLVLAYLFMFEFQSVKIDLYGTIVTGMKNIVTSTIPKSDFKIDEIEIPTGLDFSTIQDIIYKEVNEDKSTQYIPDTNLEFLSGVTMTGKQVLNLIDSTSEYLVAYLVQTNDIRDRHGKKTYRNFGYLLADAELNGSVYYIELQDAYTLYLDDFNEMVFNKLDDLRNSRYIFYIRPRSSYSVDLIYDSKESVLGFTFTEVE